MCEKNYKIKKKYNNLEFLIITSRRTSKKLKFTK